MKENFMARALNKNKKPETNNKNRARNYFLGSFGSPCGFWRLAFVTATAFGVVAAVEQREAAFGCEAVVNAKSSFLLTLRSLWVYDGFAAERCLALLDSCYRSRPPDIPFKRLRSFLHHPPTKC
ncbi:hypothetical protein [Pseudomonas mandelii]|uniref:hypothetical protein n=1 Tax=Pseudomonas mandelii TaxID=75612 RepID=UPI0020A07A6E|nr:hypothetical protein [Pseudomonas mandelii]MCO8311346.1 hypothetical protein [Pseudomonas mandelii]